MSTHAYRAATAAVVVAVVLVLLAPATPAGAAPAGPDDAEVVAAVGDSLTAGSVLDDPETQAYPAVAGIEGAGVAGSCVVDDDSCYADPLPRWFADAVRDMRHRPDTVVALIGINDIGVGKRSREVVDGYRTLERLADRLGVRLVFATLLLLPTSPSLRQLADVRVRVNEWIRSQATYVDFAAALRDGPWLDERYDSGDGLHVNAAANRRMAATLREWIEADAETAAG